VGVGVHEQHGSGGCSSSGSINISTEEGGRSGKPRGRMMGSGKEDCSCIKTIIISVVVVAVVVA